MNETVSNGLRTGGGWLIGLGVALVALGILSISAPIVTGVAVAIMVGAVVVGCGILQFISSFQSGSWGRGILGVLMGLISVVAGALMIAHPLMGLGFLTLLISSYFLIQGAFEIVDAFRHRPAAGWGWMLFSGVVSLLLGILIWRQWPLSGEWAVGVLVGVRVLFSGWSAVMVGMASRQLGRS